MRSHKKTKIIQIIGGGFSGLTLAYYLNKKGFKIKIIEKKKILGGLLQSEKHPLGLIESGANGILETSLVQELFLDLKIEPVRAKKKSSKRYIYRNGKLRRFPLNFFETLRFLLGFIFFSLFRSSLAHPKKRETVFDWGNRIFGKSACFWMISPILQGIYGTQAKYLSAYLVFKKFFKKPKKKNKKTIQVPKLIAPKKGMNFLIKNLENILKKKGVQFQYLKKIEHLDQTPTILATDLFSTKTLLLNSLRGGLKNEEALNKANNKYRKEIKEKKEAKQALEVLETISLLSVTLFYNSPSLFQGFGVLFPDENIKALGVLNNGDIFDGRLNEKNETHLLSKDPFDSSEILQKNDATKITPLHSETWIYGGKGTEKKLHANDEQLLIDLQNERKKIFKINSKPISYKISKWPNALPLYNTHLEKFLNLSFIQSKIAPSLKASRSEKKKKTKSALFLTGNYLGQIGLSAILEYNKQLSNHIEKQHSSIMPKSLTQRSTHESLNVLEQ